MAIVVLAHWALGPLVLIAVLVAFNRHATDPLVLGGSAPTAVAGDLWTLRSVRAGCAGVEWRAAASSQVRGTLLRFATDR